MNTLVDSHIVSNRARAERAYMNSALGAGMNPLYISTTVNVKPPDYVPDTGIALGSYPTDDALLQKVQWNDTTSQWDDFGEPIATKSYVDFRNRTVVDSMQDLEGDVPSSSEINLTDTPTRKLIGFYTGREQGGGDVVWKPNKPKSDHDGGVVIDPLWANGVFADTQDPNWFNADPDNTGNGVWVRDIGNTLNISKFGAQDGDITHLFQAALDTNIINIVLPKGGNYTVDGALVSNSTQIIHAHGATVKLKDNASNVKVLDMLADNSEVRGGLWDANQINNGSSTSFGAYTIKLGGNRSYVRDSTLINCAKMGVKLVNTNYSVVRNCDITGHVTYGIFGDWTDGAMHYGNRAVNNEIDVSSATDNGQGILFTASNETEHWFWRLTGNDITGVDDFTNNSFQINLAVRGSHGFVRGNTTRFGAMGFSEGKDNTVIADNKFLDLRGITRLGIESLGANNLITNNIVTNALSGVQMSANTPMDNTIISDNNIRCDESENALGVFINSNVNSVSAINMTISGNTLIGARNGVRTQGPVDNMKIIGNTMVGRQDGTSNAGIFIDNPSLAAYVFVENNIIDNFTTTHSIFSADANEYTDLYSSGNIIKNVDQRRWAAEGSATIGNNVKYNHTNRKLEIVDQKRNIKLGYVFGTSVEGGLVAGPGSLVTLNNGEVWRKASGTGNTGWKKLADAV